VTAKHAACAVFVPLAIAAVSLPLQSDADAVRLEPAVTRYLDRVANPLTSYRAYRRLEAHGMGRSGWLEAWTTVDGRGMTYEIVAEGGAGSVRDRVLHKVLKSEQQAWMSGEAQRSGITADNYDFLQTPERPEGLVKVLLKPRRKGMLIVNGAMFLDRYAADLVRVEGRLTSNPSFWVSRVDVTRRYARISGQNLPVEIHSVADLRFAGDARFHMTFRYTHVNGRTIGGTAVAAANGR
jgi:hypothetical protein